ncbi:palmitoyl-protein thioesterase 2 [Bombus vancouverensis nearcticus]|uniref:palmitoyl-CoA hydrolase n=2 Tax=Pyrobombus TaxID=144703 RepID=A0A6P8NGQ9_9HYME|nr:lysosomal thioesterase PPT2 homolog [Bombus impatiens]XP_033182922.1 lysosomal thioesterase PPT2 homolog [Bombus vancouverensis nearcticus]XP_033319299.1 lysosomal thioesterase PPT2 homolog [Bombus bifarius]XP_050488626.1 lysosomal thioesterase PPT2 homolog isoform X1 [Bombus huntii]
MATVYYSSFIVILFLSLFNNGIECYHAVVVIHGVLTGSDSMELISNRIQEMHPGTQIYNTPRYAGWSSLESMWHQVEEIGMDVMSVGAAFPEGINLVGYSQGGLLARTILQRFPDHNVRNFISLSSPQAGQYGTQFLHLFFPNLVCQTAYELFYSKIGQHTSIGNYWNDPHHQELYYKYSTFLPYVNNEKNSTKMLMYKQGLTKLERMVLVGGPEDGVITPWQSSHFGYYDVNETVIDMRDRRIYKDDLIGLKTLDESGRLVLITVPNVPHYEWHKNVSIVDDFLLPYLD